MPVVSECMARFSLGRRSSIAIALFLFSPMKPDKQSKRQTTSSTTREFMNSYLFSDLKRRTKQTTHSFIHPFLLRLNVEAFLRALSMYIHSFTHSFVHSFVRYSKNASCTYLFHFQHIRATRRPETRAVALNFTLRKNLWKERTEAVERERETVPQHNASPSLRPSSRLLGCSPPGSDQLTAAVGWRQLWHLCEPEGAPDHRVAEAHLQISDVFKVRRQNCERFLSLETEVAR
mmetsp:Transcript_14182/g.28444  ORF Transcript_14182/g.28444 Transcript_14182/m.28444 type:complete len:233 (-) Transcript_14182:539-1237(-)